MERRREPVRFLGGRNFIESMVYTLTYLEFQHRLEYGVSSLSLLSEELERQLCGLARALPQLKEIYHRFVVETLRDMYPDYPLPDLGRKCRVRDTIIEWLEKNKRSLFKDKISIVHPEKIRAVIVDTANSIVYESVMGALYSAGVLSHA